MGSIVVVVSMIYGFKRKDEHERDLIWCHLICRHLICRHLITVYIDFGYWDKWEEDEDRRIHLVQRVNL